ASCSLPSAGHSQAGLSTTRTTTLRYVTLYSFSLLLPPRRLCRCARRTRWDWQSAASHWTFPSGFPTSPLVRPSSVFQSACQKNGGRHCGARRERHVFNDGRA
ncbi:hypothetical protein APHAL10511_008683, partial [Amanita phalloides]